MFSEWVEAFHCKAIFTVAKKLLKKCATHLGHTFHNFQLSRYPLYWVSHISLNRNLANFLELPLSLSPQSSGKVKRTNGKNIFKQNIY